MAGMHPSNGARRRPISCLNIADIALFSVIEHKGRHPIDRKNRDVRRQICRLAHCRSFQKWDHHSASDESFRKPL
jgi:hypothetical protein